MANRPTRERASDNVQLQCAVKGCFKPRSWTLQYCNTHQRLRARYGNPTVHHLFKKEFKPYLLQVRAVFAANADHVGLREAERVMARILQPGQEPWSRAERGHGCARRLLWENLTRLKRAGVTAREALEVTCAVWTLAQEQDRRFPSRETIAFAIASSVFRLAKLAVMKSYYNNHTGKLHKSIKVPAAGPLRLLGNRIMDELPNFAATVMKAVEASKQAQLEALAAQREPLKPAKPRKSYTRRAVAGSSPLPASSRSSPPVQRVVRKQPDLTGPIPDATDFIN